MFQKLVKYGILVLLYLVDFVQSDRRLYWHTINKLYLTLVLNVWMCELFIFLLNKLEGAKKLRVSYVFSMLITVWTLSFLKPSSVFIHLWLQEKNKLFYLHGFSFSKLYSLRQASSCWVSFHVNQVYACLYHNKIWLHEWKLFSSETAVGFPDYPDWTWNVLFIYFFKSEELYTDFNISNVLN